MDRKLIEEYARGGAKLAAAVNGLSREDLLRVPPAGADPKLGKWGVDLSSLDRSVKAGDNFFLYVNGGYLKTAAIPPDRSSTGSFQDLQILSEERLKTIIDDLEKKPDHNLLPEEKKIRDLYDEMLGR